MELEIEIIQKDIDLGKSQRTSGLTCHVCPIAQALTRLGYEFGGVGTKCVSNLIVGDTKSRYFLDYNGMEFVRSFDRYEQVFPTTIKLQKA